MIKITFLTAVTILQAVAAHAMTADQCSIVPDNNARLLCYDAIFKNQEPSKPSEPVKPLSKWTAENATSKMDDSHTVNLSLFAEGSSTSINIRCEEKVTSFYFTMGGKFLADIQGYGVIRYRFDADKSQKKDFTVSTDNEALGLWSGGSAIPFIKQMIGHQKLIVQITPYNESQDTVEFDITGIDEAISPLRMQCKW
ncbi:hypothetical protein HJB89_11160 [Rhizobium sp. NZLR8]|uniref:type VI secretion system-associated protein TagO n=1 Tax=Rhizobium sp. NZLR8 TaxID=2731104 RepID=UPI001C82ABE1|nr:type VI secretion system-associated protein TagO [Rhizobium sp. NZLR8]MBX5157680.1 hypothetical protein [Rhizobium sp. NZLR8]